MRCVLVGNYGVNNLGDEALRDYFLHAFPQVEWVVLSAHPAHAHELPRLPGGIRSLCRPWWKTIQAMRTADAVVFGGGTLFTDVESVYACFLWWIHAAVAWIVGTPVILAFQGMGPYRTWVGEWCARWAAHHAVCVIVRDGASAARVNAWELNTKVVQSFDPVFSLMEQKKYPKNTTNVFSIIPRHNSGENLRQQAARLLKEHQHCDVVHILLMQPENIAEQETARMLCNTVGESATIIPIRTLDELMKEVCNSSLVLTQRFHGALAGLAARVPTHILPQGEGDKLSQLVPYARGEKSVDELTREVTRGHEALRTALQC